MTGDECRHDEQGREHTQRDDFYPRSPIRLSKVPNAIGLPRSFTHRLFSYLAPVLDEWLCRHLTTAARRGG
jgi:hypothetical protein